MKGKKVQSFDCQLRVYLATFVSIFYIKVGNKSD